MRVVGLADWSPNTSSRLIVDQVVEVLHDLAGYLPLTGRQVFYRMVGVHGYPKTEEAYASLLEKINRGRRCGLIPWETIRDDGTSEYSWPTFAGEREWLDDVAERAEDYRRDRQENQKQFIELWVEAAGMAPQVSSIVWRFGVPVLTSGGFNSTTMKYEAARRFITRLASTYQRTLVLHIGDHDPSGVALFDNLSRDVPALARDIIHQEDLLPEGEDLEKMEATGLHAGEVACEFHRIVVTPDQIERFDLEEAPPKRTDSRSSTWVGGTVQVEAMHPEDLANEISECVQNEMDEEILTKSMVAESDEGDAVLGAVQELARLIEDGLGQ